MPLPDSVPAFFTRLKKSFPDKESYEKALHACEVYVEVMADGDGLKDHMEWLQNERRAIWQQWMEDEEEGDEGDSGSGEDDSEATEDDEVVLEKGGTYRPVPSNSVVRRHTGRKGYGIFTNIKLERGGFFPYCGRLLGATEAANLTDRRYLARLPSNYSATRHTHVDGNPNLPGVKPCTAAYLNDDPYQPYCFFTYLPSKEIFALVLGRDAPRNCELTWDYGSQYDRPWLSAKEQAALSKWRTECDDSL